MSHRGILARSLFSSSVSRLRDAAALVELPRAVLEVVETLTGLDEGRIAFSDAEDAVVLIDALAAAVALTRSPGDLERRSELILARRLTSAALLNTIDRVELLSRPVSGTQVRDTLVERALRGELDPALLATGAPAEVGGVPAVGHVAMLVPGGLHLPVLARMMVVDEGRSVLELLILPAALLPLVLEPQQRGEVEIAALPSDDPRLIEALSALSPNSALDLEDLVATAVALDR